MRVYVVLYVNDRCNGTLVRFCHTCGQGAAISISRRYSDGLSATIDLMRS